MSKLRGLPSEVRMRHDVHFVEELEANRSAGSVGSMVDIDLLDVNPHQPRKSLGDLGDLVSSIKEKGLLEPILIRRNGARYQIIAGERRYHACKAAGLSQIPCIEMEVDERGVLEISLIENLQRRDLSAFEEADAIQYLCERFEYTHERIAQKLGKSRTSVTELLSIAGLPEEVRELCRHADISSKSLLLEIARQNSVPHMHRLVEMIGRDGLSREEARRVKDAPLEQSPISAEDPRASRPYTFRFRCPERRFSIKLKFDRPEVHRDEIISALRELITQIENGESIP